MAVSRLVFAGTALVALGAAVMVAAIAAAMFRPDGQKSAAAVRPGHGAAAGPKAAIDHLTYNAGVIESAAEMEHAFVIRNEGQTPLRLTRGPSSRLHAD